MLLEFKKAHPGGLKLPLLIL